MKNQKTYKIILLIISFIIVISSLMFIFPKQEKLTAKNSVPVYFVKVMNENNVQIIPVRRKVTKEDDFLEIGLNNLFSGPTDNEKKLGYFSEIPQNCKIIEIKNDATKLTINLSKKFAIGGGTQSMETRLRQIIYTTLDIVDNKPVYLEVEGKKINFIGGEGVEVPQPLNKNINKSRDV